MYFPCVNKSFKHEKLDVACDHNVHETLDRFSEVFFIYARGEIAWHLCPEPSFSSAKRVGVWE